MTRTQKIVVADDDPNMQLAIKTALMRAQFETVIFGDGKGVLQYLENDTCDLIITDQRMPEVSGQEILSSLKDHPAAPPVVMITAHGTVTQAVEAMQLGAADFIMKPFSAEDLLRVVEKVLSPEGQEFRAKPTKGAKGRAIVTNDGLMIRILEVCEAVARSEATVLVQGESGTGKELIARLIHTASPRSTRPFVAVNCAALPANLLESELFGHEKGAFTGAQQRKIGKFELAHGGTILLDEVSEMDIILQAKLLRVLQEREVDRVGGKEPIHIDVRVVATTNRNLEESVRRGEFRADLFYRLNVIPITVPALRERRGDIRLIAKHFMRQHLGDRAPELPEDVLRMLDEHAWPGNVRELQNAVERAAILARGETPSQNDFLLGLSSLGLVGSDRRTGPQIGPQRGPQTGEFPRVMKSGGFLVEVSRSDESTEHSYEEGRSVPDVGESPSDGLYGVASAMSTGLQVRPGTTVGEMERLLILETLKTTRWNRTEASKMLGISIRTLRNKLHEYRAAGQLPQDAVADE